MGQGHSFGYFMEKEKQVHKLGCIPKVQQPGIWKMWDSNPGCLTEAFTLFPIHSAAFLIKIRFWNSRRSFKRLPNGQVLHDDFYGTSESPVIAVLHSLHAH